MTKFEPVEGESAPEGDARRGRAVMGPGAEAEWEEFGTLAAEEEVPPTPEVPEEFVRPPRGERIRPVPKPVAPTRRERTA